ncbi:MAG: LysR family transcriptional regulator [Myxococcaceae bacterium]|nr:LysR family transcriptional regulator [Myxococcaceae bacterium]
MMTLQRLEGFYWVARTGGYARAARTFPYPITQPGVHQQVRRLETEVGVRLFERVGKDQVALTPAGQALFDVVAPFYEQLPALEARLKGGQVGGTLKIHAGGHLLRHLMPSWLQRLQSRRPDISVSLTEASTAQPKALLSGEADLVVDWFPTLPEGVQVREVAQVRAFVAAPTHGPYAVKGKVPMSALSKTPFIAYQSDRTLRGLQEQALREQGISPRVLFTADSSDTILGFVAAGLGFSLVPSLVEGGPRLAGVLAWPVVHARAKFAVHAAWRRREVLSPLIEAALEVAPR